MRKLRGSPRSQVSQILEPINMIGKKRHEAKERIRKEHAPRTPSFHDLNKHLGIYSYATYDTYRKVLTDFLTYVREMHDIRSAMSIRDEHVRRYLERKISPGLGRPGIKKSTLKGYCAALEKLQMSLNTYYGGKADWTPILDDVKRTVEGTLPKPRAFERPVEIVAAIDDPLCQTLAQIQLFAGARVKEANRLKPKNLLGDNRVLLTHTKGGRRRIVALPPEIYAKVDAEILRNGVFRVDYKPYTEQLFDACQKVGVEWNGTHGLRWNYAQMAFDSALAQGLPEQSALLRVAEDLGHSRESITRHYLRR